MSLMCVCMAFFLIRFEAGTPAIAQAVGLAAAVDYLQGIGMQTVHEREVSRANKIILVGMHETWS